MSNTTFLNKEERDMTTQNTTNNTITTNNNNMFFIEKGSSRVEFYLKGEGGMIVYFEGNKCQQVNYRLLEGLRKTFKDLVRAGYSRTDKKREVKAYPPANGRNNWTYKPFTPDGERYEYYADRIDTLWAERWESRQDSVESRQHDISELWGEGVAVEQFRWLDEKEVAVQTWDLEQRVEWIRLAVKDSHTLMAMAKEDQDISDKEYKSINKKLENFRKKLWTDLMDVNESLNEETKILLREEEKELEFKSKSPTSWERGINLHDWLEKKAEFMTANELVYWNRQVNERRKLKDPEVRDYRLSFVHWVACKLILEGALMKIYPEGTRAQVRAEESYNKYVDMYYQYNVGPRIDENATCQFDDELIDPDAAYFGRPGVVHQRYATIIDLKNRLCEDETVLQGYLLACEDEISMPTGTKNVSAEIAVLAMLKARGNQAAAARMVKMPYSTFRDRLKTARKILEEKLDANVISSSEYNAFRRMIG